MNSAWKTPQKFWLLQKNRALYMKIYRQLMVASPGKLRVQNMNKLNKSCFGSLSIINRGFLVAKFSKIVGSRAGIYRLLLVACLIHLIATVSGSLFIDRKITMSITDYLNNSTINEEQMFQIVNKKFKSTIDNILNLFPKFGILKPGSIEIKRGTLQTKFAITDFKNEIEVLYKGSNKFEFKEGETIVLTCYLPDKTKKNVLFCIDYIVKHSMELNDWQDKNNVKRT